jgi:hypothetical protein
MDRPYLTPEDFQEYNSIIIPVCISLRTHYIYFLKNDDSISNEQIEKNVFKKVRKDMKYDQLSQKEKDIIESVFDSFAGLTAVADGDGLFAVEQIQKLASN